MSKLQVLEKLRASCETATTLLGGEQYATLSVVLPLGSLHHDCQ